MSNLSVLLSKNIWHANFYKSFINYVLEEKLMQIIVLKRNILHALSFFLTLTDPPPLRGPVYWSGILALGVSCIMVWMQDKNEAHSRENFDSKPKKKFFLHHWSFGKKNSQIISGNFFRIFFRKKTPVTMFFEIKSWFLDMMYLNSISWDLWT